jgi:quercetin dioxygenase-like cupin family protein
MRWVLIVASLASLARFDRRPPESLALHSPEELPLDAPLAAALEAERGFAAHAVLPDVVLQDAPQIVIDNEQVRVYRTTAASADRIEHGPGVVVSLEASTLGTAVWMDDAASSSPTVPRGAVAIVQPRRARSSAPPGGGSRPGDAPFTGMSFKTIFENDRVTAIRARMEVGAREGFHTHASDTIVVHLSGGEIEDTADGKTVVNRWKRGDVEFEGLGTSHSARNVGQAVDVVLVALRPQ